MSKRIDLTKIKKILLIRLRPIGDIVMTTPALSILRRELPHAFISYVVEPPYRELIEGHPALDEVLIIKRKSSFIEFLKFIGNIRKRKYDLAIDFHCGPRASLITFFSNAKIKVGFRVKYRHLLYDIKVPRKKEKGGYFHSVESHVNLLKAIGIKPEKIPSLFLSPSSQAEKERVQNFFIENNIFNFKKIVLHISAGNKYRDWGVENFVKLIELLNRHKNLKVIIIGDRKDKEIEEKIGERVEGEFLSLVGEINLKELRELISRANLFVGSDSGPMHVAATTQTPIVALFGPTTPNIFGPWMAKATIIEKKLDCRPCRQKECIYEDFRCLRTIRPEEVYKASIKALEREN
jgi:heptosyltransferase-1